MLENYYLWLKALHLIAVIAWMAGLLYLPRLFVYHVEQQPGSEAYEMLKAMERRLLRVIMNPAMIATFALGILLAVETRAWDAREHGGWFHAKLVLVIGLAAAHGMMAKYRRDFAANRNRRSEKFFRVFNEIPTLLMIGIVILAVLKPF